MRGVRANDLLGASVNDTERASIVAELRREVALACGVDGVIVWSDDIAERTFGAIVGRSLASLCLSGTEDKAKALIDEGLRAPVVRCELPLMRGGRPATFVFSARPCDGGVVLLGRDVGDEEEATFGRMAAAMSELAEAHRETERQRRELLDSNRALLTMHSVLDDKNDALRRASDVKSRVVANVSHEFRTPINSILGITRILLDRLDGELTSEQEKQVKFVRSSAESLSDLVNDLLDLSRIEAGRHDLRATSFDVTTLFSSLRGMMKPLLREGVELVIEDTPSVRALDTDDGKLSQILRNLVANAIKFTERGSITVSASESAPGKVRFEVKDTGVGIAPADHERIFEEFEQINGPHQRGSKGTGLGLALSRRLAEILGGTLTVRSRLGEGATFVLEIPRTHDEVASVQAIVEKAAAIDATKSQILVVEDNRQTLFFYERYLSGAGFQVIPARTVDEAREALSRVRPAAIVLDVMLEGEVTWSFLAELKESLETRDIPVMVVTVVDRSQKARALGADEFWLKPVDGDRLIRKLGAMSKRGVVGRVLVIDDDEASRYLIRKILQNEPYVVLEAADGASGVRLARTQRPDVIFLDFLLTDETAFDVLDDLKVDPDTRNIPVIIQTAKTLDEAERAKLEQETTAILRKQSLSRELAITRIREALEGSRAQQPAARS